MWRGYWRRAWGLTGHQRPEGMRGWVAATFGPPGGHSDVAHGDAAHGDVAHGDANKGHLDTPHADTPHTDTAHVDTTSTGAAIRMR